VKTALAVAAGLAVLLAVLLGAPVVAVVGLTAATQFSGAGGAGEACWANGPTAQLDGQYEGDDVAGYGGEQLAIAATIIAVGAERELPVRAQTIAVMTGMGESGLRNVDYGDDRYGVRNPDGSLTSSIGVFQEQKWYGTVAERMDPAGAASRFYDRLLQVDAWQTLEPTIAAHKAQRNADPYHYAKYWDSAVDVVAALTGSSELPGTSHASTRGPCSAAGERVDVGVHGWANPAEGRLASGFGPRAAPTVGASTFHQGTDVAAVCGTPLYAAADGVVTVAGLTQWGTGNEVRIDHGNGLGTVYGHVLSGTYQVAVGDIVSAGQQIASMGGDRSIDPAGAGTSTGCHLHFEVHQDGQAIDPRVFLAGQGVALGQPAS
jgi:murein DD-endopeptidase MepM/ murein hydrolase activator NlpD